MSNTMFENFDLWMDETLEDEKPFIVACKDIENSNGDDERWMLTSLSEEEAKTMYDYLHKYFK